MSQQLNRRTIITGTLGAAAAASVFKSNFFFSSKLHSKKYLYACGSRSARRSDRSFSSFTRLDLSDGSFSQIELPTKDLHSMIHIGNKIALISNSQSAFLINEELQVEKTFMCRSDEEFGGHAIYLSNHNAILIGKKPSKESRKPQEGKLCVLNAQTFKPMAEIESGGFDPHDMQWLSNDQFAVCNYGDKFASDLLEYRNLHPIISIFDAKSLKLVHKIEVPNMGSISHIAATGDHSFAAINALLFPLVDQSIPIVKNLLDGRDFEISQPERDETRLAAASNVFFYQEDKLVQSILTEPLKQRRAQSICYHKPSRSIFVTYSYSNYLGCIRNGKVTLISGQELGLETVRGVLSMDESIYVNGQHHDIVELSANDLTIRRHFKLPLLSATHIFS